MGGPITQESLMYAVYFAPRGKVRLLQLGYQLGQRHLSPLDKLIGVIGDAGAGKSLLIRGMFPGLELTNDDSGINIRPLPLLSHAEEERFAYHMYHVDLRFELAFTPLYQLAEAVKAAIDKGCRVVVEHFELLYPALKMNAEILIGIGEEVIVTRPNIFGPLPSDIAKMVFKSVRYRRMAHTAEDLTGFILKNEGNTSAYSHDDVKHGFVLEFTEKPAFDLQLVERKVLRLIEEGVAINYCDEEHIKIGDFRITCTGPRIHLRNSAEVENFHLIHELKYDPFSKLYLLVGLVGTDYPENLNDLNNFLNP
jgi:tRNA A37 threonylcarbamoyladenosine biosynthesis protein TsaE